MGKVKRKHVEGSTQEERKRRRAALGSLHSLTVQPKTRDRYNKALEQFWAYLPAEGIRVPHEPAERDGVLCCYVEHLWSEGFGRVLASDTYSWTSGRSA